MSRRARTSPTSVSRRRLVEGGEGGGGPTRVPCAAVPWAKFTSLSWLKDGSGFFYTRYPAPSVDASKAGTETASTLYSMVCFHPVGGKAEDDLLVWAEPSEPSWIHGCEVTDDGEYVLVSTSYGTDPVNKLAYAHLPSGFSAWRAGGARGVQAALDASAGAPPPYASGAYLPLSKFVDTFVAEWEYIANDGPRFILKTNLNACVRWRFTRSSHNE